MDDQDEITSFIANEFTPSKEFRRAFGTATGQQVGTFILARRDWSAAWETFAMRAVADVLFRHGLTEMSLLRSSSHRPRKTWTSRFTAELMPPVDYDVEVQGREAAEQWALAITRADSEFVVPWWRMLLMWSSEDGASRVLAQMADSDTDDRGYPPGTAGWGADRDESFRVVVFFAWGTRSGEVLAALDATASAADDHFTDVIDRPAQ